jgi:hypothetical protein
MFLKFRINRLEAKQRRQRPPERAHHVSLVHVPWGADTADYQTHLLCPCGGGAACPSKTIGLVVPTPAPTKEAWAEEAHRYYREWADR